MLRRFLVVPAATLLLVAACSDDDPVDPTTTSSTSSTGGSGGMTTTSSSGGMTGTGGSGGSLDTIAPTVAITDDVMDMTATGDVTFTFTFSEDVGSSFEAADVTVTGGTAGAFTNVDATTATLVVSPPAQMAGTIEVSVAAGAFEDLAGNPNSDGAMATQDYDTITDTVLFDFEGAPTHTGFGNVNGQTVVDPTDGNNNVGELDKTAAAELWGGVTVSACSNFSIVKLPFAAGTTTMTMRVWSPDANIPIRVKVENANDPNVSVETEASTTMAMAWETLTFDFSNQVVGTAAIDFNATYDKISVFPNFGTTGAMAGQKTYYIDDITFVGAVFPTACPVVLRPDPADDWIAYNGGTPALQNSAGGANVGDAAAGAAYVIPFVMPTIPAGGFTSANLEVHVIATAGAMMNAVNGDLYGLPFRTANDATMNGVVLTSMFHADPVMDATATLLVDNFLMSTAGNNVFIETDGAGDTALVNYLNAQVQAGAVAGDYVYLRLSPDLAAPIGAATTWVVSAAVDNVAPPERPTLTVQ